MSSLPPDPWRILGIDKSADKGEIRTAYRKLVLRCHPDKVQDATLKAQKQDEFQRVQQAYELLNDDGERTKYEQQVKLEELRKQAAAMSKNMANSSAARTPPRAYDNVYIRTAEPPRSYRTQPSPAAKVYTQYTSASRSWDDDLPRHSQTVYEEHKSARRTASYDKPSSYEKASRKDDERRESERREREREERKRREKEEERERREKEIRKAEKKRLEREREKERERDRKRESEEKSRRHNKSPYVEEYMEDDGGVYASAKADKKKSSKTKLDEPRERDKSSSRRERGESPRESPREQPRVSKHEDYLESAAAYIESSRRKTKDAPPFSRSATFHVYETPVAVPTPPPAEAYEDDARRSMGRARRSSHDTPKLPREKSYTSQKKSSSREAVNIVEASPRTIPSFQKSTSAPPPAPESPPRNLSRSNTDFASPRPAPNVVPGLARASTWMSGEHVDRTRRGSFGSPLVEEPDDEEPRHHRHRSSRRTHSPEPHRNTTSHVYQVDSERKTRRVDPYYGDESPSTRKSSKYNSPRFHVEEVDEASPYDRVAQPYASSPMFAKVKQTKDYTADDVKFGQMENPYSSHRYEPQYAATSAYA